MVSGNWEVGAKTLAITLNGESVAENVVTVTLVDDMNGTSDPKIGSTCAAQLMLVIQKPSVQYAGKTISAAIAGIPLGTFTVTGVSAKDERAEIVAMDAMATAFEADYVPAVSSSTALTVIRDVCSVCGVTVGDVSDITDVPVTDLSAGHTGREMIGLMAALLGRNAHIDRTGKLVLRWYEPSGVTITANDYYPGEITKQDADYTIDRIECTVHIQDVTVVDGITTEESSTTVYAAGVGTTGISVEDDYMTQAILNGVYADIGGLTYRPLSVTFYGDARIETGDLITVRDSEGGSYSVPVMKVTHIWDGGVRTTVEAFGNPTEGLSVSTSGFLSRSVSNLITEFARFQNLEAENMRALRAKIEEIIAGDIELYGRMSVYQDDSLKSVGGHFGYTVGSEVLLPGMYMESVEVSLEGQSLMVLSPSGFFVGHKPDYLPLDGSDDPVDTAPYNVYIQSDNNPIASMEIHAPWISLYVDQVGTAAQFGYLYDRPTDAFTQICRFFGKVFVNDQNIEEAIAAKQDALTFDTSPQPGSTNPVTSGGIHTALSAKQDTLTFDGAPTAGSTNPVASGGVYTAIADVPKAWYGFCSTRYGVAEKVVACDGFGLYDGATIVVLFQWYNSANNIMLNVNNTGAKYVYYATGGNVSGRWWRQYGAVQFVYRQANDAYFMVGGNIASTAYYGLTKLYSGVDSDAVDLAATASAVKMAYDTAEAKQAKRVLLWENASPGSSFAHNTVITLADSLANYDAIEIGVAANFGGVRNMETTLYPRPDNAADSSASKVLYMSHAFMDYDTNASYVQTRHAIPDWAGNSITFLSGTYIKQPTGNAYATLTIDQTREVPAAVWGVRY